MTCISFFLFFPIYYQELKKLIQHIFQYIFFVFFLSSSSSDLGKYGLSEGICSPCAAGTFQDTKGEQSCQKCPVDTYLSEEGKSSKADCEKCSSDKSTGSTRGNMKESSCLCRRTDFYRGADATCMDCPSGANCSKNNGMQLAEIHALPGYWRSALDNDEFTSCGEQTKEGSHRCCPNGCINLNVSTHADAQCLEGYASALCKACAKDYTIVNGACTPCPGGGSFGQALIPMLSSCFLLFLIVLVFVLRSSGKSTDANFNRLEKLKRKKKLFGQMKILLSLMQIMASMPSVITGVDFSPFFRNMANVFGVFNMDVLSFSGDLDCGMSVRFFYKFLVHMMLPIGCMAAIIAAFGVAKVCTAKANTVKRTQINEAVSKVVILIILLLYPGLSTKVFQVWKCQSVAGIKGQYLVQDFNVICNEGEHMTFVVLAIGFLLLYIVGIPLAMLMLLCRNRKHLHDEQSPKHHAVKNALGGLYSQCECCCLRYFIFFVFFPRFLLLYVCYTCCADLLFFCFLRSHLSLQMNQSTGGLSS